MKNSSGSMDFEKYLKDIEYPASKEEIIEAAQNNSAPEDVIAELSTLEDDAQFENVMEVKEALDESEEDEEEGGVGTPAEEGEVEDEMELEDDDDKEESDSSEEDDEAA